MGYHGKDNEKKIPYDRWVYAKSLIDKLREEGGLSMTEVSREACGNGDTPGWTESAYRHRTIVREHQIRNMEHFLQPKRRTGMKEGDTRLSRDAQKEFHRLLRRLRDFYHWDNHQIGGALNVAATTISRMVNGHGGGTLALLHKVQGLVDGLDKANRNGHVETEDGQPLIRIADTKSPPMPKPELEPEPAVQAAPGRPSTLQAARAAGAVFLAALEALEAELPAFAKQGAADLRKRAAGIVADLGAGD